MGDDIIRNYELITNILYITVIKKNIKNYTPEIQYYTCGLFTQYDHFNSIIEFSFGWRIVTELRPG